MSQSFEPLPDWFSANLGNFEKYLSCYAERPGVQGLQIGAYVGDASVWLLDHVLTGLGSWLTDVDTWQGTANEAIHQELDWQQVWRIYLARMRARPVTPMRMTSDEYFDFRPGVRFDFVYIDGDHRALQVHRDAVHADAVLKVGGVLAFDDYGWGHGEDVPRVAIERFLAEQGSRYDVVERSWQLWCIKQREA